jgi:hypothetical protein
MLAGILLTPRTKSHAHCEEKPAALVWSYPADHDTDIALDASVQLLTASPLEGNWRAELNGKELTAERLRQLRLERKIEDDDETQVYPLGDLDPDTEYTFQLTPEDEGTPWPPIAISFRTGAERTPAAIAPQVLGSKVSQAFPKMTAGCVAVAIHNNCEERLGPVRSLQVESPHAVAWLVNRLDEHAEFWPIDCAPVSDEPVTKGTSPCFQLRTVNARGEHSPVTQYCPQSADNSRENEPSCSTTHVGGQAPTTWPSALLALLALKVWYRRSRVRH